MKNKLLNYTNEKNTKKFYLLVYDFFRNLSSQEVILSLFDSKQHPSPPGKYPVIFSPVI
jgi:hypothetical protein